MSEAEAMQRIVSRATMVPIALFAAACAMLAPRPEAPAIALEGLRIERVASDETRVALTLAMENPNDREVTIDALEFSLSIAGAPVATGALAAPLSLPARGSGRADIVATTTLAAVRTALDASLRRRSIDYELSGTVVVSGRALRFARRGRKTVADFLDGQ
jgi:LEA14-like dessication related protein